MSQYDIALTAHLLGVLLFFGGMLVALVSVEAARRRARTGDVAVLLGLAPLAVLLVGSGAGVAFVTGFWLIDATGGSLGDGWLLLALAALVLSAVLGALGGRRPKQARLLAERSPADEPVSDDLRLLLGHRPSRVLNTAAGLAGLAVLVLMVWRPDL